MCLGLNEINNGVIFRPHACASLKLFLSIYSITRDFGEDSDGTKSVESESASEEESVNDKDSSSTGTVNESVLLSEKT